METIRKKLEALAFRPVEIDQIMGIVQEYIDDEMSSSIERELCSDNYSIHNYPTT